MKTLVCIAVIGLIITLLSILSAFRIPEQIVEIDQRAWSQELAQSIAKLKQVAEAYNEQILPLDSLKSAVSQTRASYKRVEFLIVYSYPDYVESRINGAPLLHINRHGSRAGVVQPEGLQVLDELIFGDEPEEEKQEIASLANTLVNSYTTLKKDFDKKKYDSDDIVLAMRQEIVSIMSLGITGFDTPGSAKGISESHVALQGIQLFADAYFADLELKAALNAAISYLEKNSDFERFDRTQFIRDYLNPIYARLADLYSESHAFKSNSSTALNPLSRNLFAGDFLDPYFYTELTKQEDSDALRELGARLFNEPDLSLSGSLSCKSCHDPAKGFTDGKKKSMSNVEGKTVERNSPTLLNAVYADRYFYDLRAFTLEQQAEHVIFNDLEFNSAYSEIIDRLSTDHSYKIAVEAAYPNRKLDREMLSKALASYVLSLQSFDSPFDRYMRGETEEIAAEVKAGFNLFMGKAACGTCHFAPTFAGLVPPQFQKSESEILGVLESPKGMMRKLDTDMGRNANNLSNEEAWIYDRSFKTSTVRNVALTAPYFHNGAYTTLEEVMEFYNKGGGAGYGLEVKNQTLSGEALGLHPSEISAIIAFMNALTDNSAGGKSAQFAY